VVASTGRNIAAGETIVQRLPNQTGRGVYRGTVSFYRAPDEITVGRFSVRLP
jgi:hypothetical protein